MSSIILEIICGSCEHILAAPTRRSIENNYVFGIPFSLFITEKPAYSASKCIYTKKPAVRFPFSLKKVSHNRLFLYRPPKFQKRDSNGCLLLHIPPRGSLTADLFYIDPLQPSSKSQEPRFVNLAPHNASTFSK